ncbi:protein kinase [Nonomuraea sp. NPDC059194]|uniref:protein kinase domain-containing protein n=1 Tax=Nonomuraea sp. NPDC059194 TaxID=3346764 RepID=UPI0036B563FF
MDALSSGDPERFGDYAIVGRLGEGPRGVVYLGRDSDDGETRAIKPLTGESAEDSETLDRLRSVKRVSSSYVARVFDVGVADGMPYVVREHVEGRSLAETVEADGPLDGDALERVAVGVLTALTSAHLAGVTHRGLTPHNVILGADGPRVTDAAIGEPVGELGYRSPEQLKELRYGPPSDVFSWAAIVVYAATGRAPFEHEARAVLDEKPDVGPLPQPLRRVVVAALSKEVAKRPTTYTALLQLLGDKNADKLVAGAPAVIVPDPAPPLEGTLRLPMYRTPEPELDPVQTAPVPAAPQAWGPPPAEPPQEPQPGPHPHPHPIVSVPAQAPPPARRPFPVGLVAAMAAVVAISAVGLWGANQYAGTATLNANTVAAEGKRVSDAVPSPNGETSTTGTGNGVTQAQPQPQGTQQGQGKVAVPWAQTPVPESTDVMPFELPTDDPSSPLPEPELTSVSSPQPVPTQNIAVPPTTAPPVPSPAPTVTVTAEPTNKPDPKPTKTKEGEPEAPPKEKPTQEPEPTPTKQKPTEPAEPTPTPTQTKPTDPVEPTPTKSAEPTPTQPKPTPTQPKPTPTEPKPTPTQPRPTPTEPKPTPTKPAEPKPTPTKPSEPPAETTNPYTPAQACGGGFYVQRQASFAGGTTYQLYNSSSGYNCVVTMKTAKIGQLSSVTATLEIQGKSPVTDSGSYKYYAVAKAYGKGSCVKFSGSTDQGSTSSGFANCG